MMFMTKLRKVRPKLMGLLLALVCVQAASSPMCLAVGEKPNPYMIAPMSLDEDINLSNEKPPGAVAPERSLSLRACFEKAFENNREIASARFSLPVARAAITIAGAIPNPHFTLLFGWGPAFTQIIEGDPEQYGWQFDLQTAGKRSKQLDVAKANYGVAVFQVAQVMFDVHNRVRRAYAQQAAAEAYEELIESQRKVALDLVHISENRFKAGKAARSELLQAQLGTLQLDTQRNQAEARLEQASAALSLIIGEVPRHTEVIDVQDNGLFKLSAEKTDLVPSADRPLPPLEQLIPVAYTERPDLKVSVQQKFSDRRALTLAKAQVVPDIFVDVGPQFTIFKRFQPYGLFNNPQTGQPNVTPNVPGCYFNVSLTNPIWYQQEGEIAFAKATWRQDFDQIKQLRAQIATDSVTAYESVVGARANIYQFQNALIPEAALVAKQAFRRYQVGKADLASAILARQQYQQILSSYFDAVVAYQNAWADLEKAIGVSLNL
jgi:cobalt-zinc-cadmium efflux system outer membrane protein